MVDLYGINTKNVSQPVSNTGDYILSFDLRPSFIAIITNTRRMLSINQYVECASYMGDVWSVFIVRLKYLLCDLYRPPDSHYVATQLEQHTDATSYSSFTFRNHVTQYRNVHRSSNSFQTNGQKRKQDCQVLPERQQVWHSFAMERFTSDIVVILASCWVTQRIMTKRGKRCH